MSVVFGLLKMLFWVPKKGHLSFSERRQDLRFSGNRQKALINSRITQVPLEYLNRLYKKLLAQPKI